MRNILLLSVKHERQSSFVVTNLKVQIKILHTMGFLLISNFFVQIMQPMHQNSLERIAMSAKNGMDFASATVNKDNNNNKLSSERRTEDTAS